MAWRRRSINSRWKANGRCAIPCFARRELAAFYKNRELEKRYVPELFVFGAIVVELKAVGALNSDHECSFSTTCGSRQPVGYLINFGAKGGLEWKRFILSDLHPLPAGPR